MAQEPPDLLPCGRGSAGATSAAEIGTRDVTSAADLVEGIEEVARAKSFKDGGDRGHRRWSQERGVRKPFSRTKCSARSVSRSAMTWALSASGKTLGQSLNGRLVVMQVARR